MNTRKTFLGAMVTLTAAGTASGAEIIVNADIAGSVTWTANNTYNLAQQIYVLPGATLTIEPGTLIASTPTIDGAGSLAVCRGGRIYAEGTATDPIIFTSKNDDLVTWREAANEWGNLSILGDAYISDTIGTTNSPTPSASNETVLEGLVAPPLDTRPYYGGGNDDDNSGKITYISLRYGGRVVGLANELNGLSLGGVGRCTEMHHIDIMNNVDDGIEIFGGTVNISHANIWNIGDDSFDIDQGWRGKAQFGLLVQGYSVSASQGSGVGDNLFETDGAENSDAQPVTTGVIYNFTAIGQPITDAGDHGTAWRDNCRMQYRNCIFMDLGDRAVSFDNLDGDGSQGYGFNGTLSWAATWTTDWNNYSAVNAPANPEDFYTSQVNGKLAEIKDSVFFRNLSASAYTEANNRGVFNAGNNNVLIAGVDDADMPIQSLTRLIADVDADGLPGRTAGGKIMLPVISIDPRAKNAATTSVNTAPADGFLVPAAYRGGFGTDNWICGWTAADAYGYVVAPPGGCDLSAPCEADLDGDNTVGFGDLLQVLSAWEQECVPQDLDGGGVGFSDLLIILGAWGPC